MASITFKNVKKTYDKSVTVIPGLNIEIKDKEFVILVGPSGCGKSTTLRMIAGLEDVSEGELYIGDRVVNNVAPKDRNIAMVFQSYALYPHMTVYKNMAFALTLSKMPKKEIEKKVTEVAKILHIEEYLQRKPKALSGGQRQRVALGRAMVREPEVFLLDEPLSNLDAKLRSQMREEIISLHKRLKTTFVYVTHDQTEAMTMADRIIVMKDGIVQQTDTPQMLYTHPQNLFVAGFIGTPQMNFINAELKEEKDRIYAYFNHFKLLLPDRMKTSLKDYTAENKVILGVRPEDVRLEGDNEHKITVNCDFTEMMGAEILVHTHIGNDKIIASVPSGEIIKDNEEINLYINTEKAHIFSPDTEELICD